MKNLKAIILFSILIAAFAVVDVLIYRRSDLVAVSSNFADYGDDVREIVIRRKGATATKLKQTEDSWRLVAPFSGAADTLVVLRLLDTLEQTSPIDVISESDLLRMGRTRADFSLEDPVLTVEVVSASKGVSKFSFGITTLSDEGVYAAVDGVDAVYVVSASLLSVFDISADGFRQRTILPIDVESIESFSLQREGDKRLLFTRDDEGWLVDGRQASSTKIAAFISDLISARAVNFVWPVGTSNETTRVSAALLASYGLDADSAVTMTLAGRSGALQRIAFGKNADAEHVYALVQNGGAVVTVPNRLKDFVVQDMVMLTDSRLFPVEQRSVTGFSLLSKDGLFSFSRSESSAWSFESPVVSPADPEAVSAILSRILSLTPADVVLEGGIVVSLSSHPTKCRVSFESVFGGRSYEDLRSREMLRIDHALVSRIVRMPGDEHEKPSAVVSNRERRTWNVERGSDGGVVDVRGVEQILAAVNPLMAVRVEKLNISGHELDDYGLDRPFLTVAIDQTAAETVRRNILIGKKTSGGRFATIGSSDAVFVISESVVKSLDKQIIEQK